MPHPPSQGYGVASIQRRKRQNRIFLFPRLGDYRHRMPEFPPEQVTPFVFSDPSGKRWPRLRLILLIGGVLFFLGTVLFVQTLSPRPRKKPPDNEVRLAFYITGDPYSYASLQQHAAQITHVCPEWMTVINGMGELQIDADPRLPKLAASKGIALMPLLTNLVGDTWQPEAIENLAHGPADRQDKFIQKVLAILREAKASGVVVDWEQIDPVYKKETAAFIDKFANALHDDNKELWLCVQPGQELDY